ncbi:AraC family transcriptional regulator [Parahaliea mediterranea]|uniref:AraC family transcriptional regulator n=1 Tax=Parahaliea mediterranea TaxID=651086 RepID=UPI000E2FBC64|nr:AraC family transcriptional regulator [Parahaliea mediterranea]
MADNTEKKTIERHYLGVIKSQADRCLKGRLDPEKYDALIRDINRYTEPSDEGEDPVAKVLQALWKATNDEYFGLAPEKVPKGTFALVCDYMAREDTLQEALVRGELILDFLPPSSLRLNVKRVEKQVHLSVRTYIGPEDPDHFLIEFYMMLWHRFLSWCIGTPLPLVRVNFSHAPMEPEASGFNPFSCPVHFRSDSSRLVFPELYLEYPVARSRTELQCWLRESPGEVVSVFRESGNLRARVRSEIQDALDTDGSIPSFQDICKRLQLSPRVVRDRLARLGTDYRHIKDDYLRKHVEVLLRDRQRDMKEVLLQSGYSDAASLIRACKRWFGLTPKGYRETL